MCVQRRWFWELEHRYKDEHPPVQQHRCPLCAHPQQHSPPFSCRGNTGRKRCCESIHPFVCKNTCTSACLHTQKPAWLNFVMSLTSTLQNLQVFLDGVSVATLDSVMLCYPDRVTVQLNVTPTEIQISANSSTVAFVKSDALQEALKQLNSTMQNPISTYIGGIPGWFCFFVKVQRLLFWPDSGAVLKTMGWEWWKFILRVKWIICVKMFYLKLPKSPGNIFLEPWMS